MTQRTLFRVGAIAAMVGAVLALVFNLLHPRGSDIDTSREELDLVADSGIWLFDHFMLAWALAIAFIGFIAIARSFTGDEGESWGRVALAVSIVSVAVAFVAVSVDGIAMKEVADNWAEAGRGTSGAAFATGDAVAMVSFALFTAVVGSLLGLTPALFGVASLMSADYPRWLGYVALAGGVVGLVTASIMYLSGPSELTTTYLISISSFLFTVWLFASGWYLWQRVRVPQAEPSRAASTAT